MDNHRFETIVVGLGAMGSAATYQLAKKGNKVLGIDRFFPPHVNGSSHGDTRVTRQAIGEGAEYVPLVLRSYDLWEEIERETARNILTITGGLIMTGAEGALRHGRYFFHQTVPVPSSMELLTSFWIPTRSVSGSPPSS